MDRRKMRFKNERKLYQLISKIPRVSPLSMKLMLKWSSKKLERYLNKLKKDGLIEEKNDRFYPTPYQKMIKLEEFNKDE